MRSSQIGCPPALLVRLSHGLPPAGCRDRHHRHGSTQTHGHHRSHRSVRNDPDWRRFTADKPGYDETLTTARRFTDEVWAVEGCNGVGRHLAQRLVHDGETVIDVPAKLSAQVRVFATGNGRKTDPGDAHSRSRWRHYGYRICVASPLIRN
ncbi:IS110 family transposase [Nocardia pseudobrasiliensis]|uniref:IS110 family transposase n=1 Tax=Nocardia pseudobrasiliensis TaxID=45979 RepID=UPI0011C07CB1|nr:IS110 family transposase [Nocardia pseudobrasiliensis]